MKRTTSKPISDRSAGRAASASKPGTSEAFGHHAEQVLAAVREAMIHLVEAIPEPINRAVDVQRALDVYAPLAWRVFRIAGTEEPLEVAEFVPTPGHIITLLEAAEKKGLPKRVIAGVRESMDAYETMRKAHAGSRERLRSMVQSLRPTEKNLIDLKCRKIAFEQNSLIWGVQTDVIIGCGIFLSRDAAGSKSFALLSGRVGFHGVRPGAASSFVASTAPEAPKPDAARLDPKHWVDSELLRDFCSPSLATRSWQGDEGMKYTKVARLGIGRRSAINYFQVSGAEFSPHENVGIDWGATTPTLMVHLDLLVPAAWKPRPLPACVYGNSIDMAVARQHRPADILPVEVSSAHLGTMSDVPAAQGVPRYSEIVRKLLESRNAYGTEFEVFRCRMAYPIMHSVVNLAVTMGA